MIPEQEWLLGGIPVNQVVCGRDKSPDRIFAPDPRLFALHKLWLSEQPARNPIKRPKDKNQGTALLNTIADSMPHYPLDEQFISQLPEPLEKIGIIWLEAHPDYNPSQIEVDWNKGFSI